MDSLAEDLAMGFLIECSSCGEVKKRSEFRDSGSSANGKTKDCAVCINALQREKSRLKREAEIKAGTRVRKDVVISRRQRALKYGAKYAEMYMRNLSGRKSASRDEALIAGVKWEKYEELDVLDTYGVECFICGEVVDVNLNRRSGAENLDYGRSLRIRHLISMKNGGGDTLENVRPSHASC